MSVRSNGMQQIVKGLCYGVHYSKLLLLNKIAGLQNSYPLVFALLDKAETFAVQIGRPKFCIPYQLIHSCFESFDISVF